MASKTANVMARVEPKVKEEAELIMAQLGVPASTVINMLYKQIIMTKGIPFSISIPDKFVTRDEMDKEMFDSIMDNGLKQAMSEQSEPIEDVFKNKIG